MIVAIEVIVVIVVLNQKWPEWVSEWVSDKVTYWAKNIPKFERYSPFLSATAATQLFVGMRQRRWQI